MFSFVFNLKNDFSGDFLICCKQISFLSLSNTSETKSVHQLLHETLFSHDKGRPDLCLDHPVTWNSELNRKNAANFE